MKKRSPTMCPVVFSLDTFGDAWSLVILRDMLFGGKSHFREFLASEEQIASNILSDRLERLIKEGMIVRTEDPTNKSATIYKPTQKTLDLLPTLIELMRWGVKYNPDIDTNNPLMKQLNSDPTGLQADALAKFNA